MADTSAMIELDDALECKSVSSKDDVISISSGYGTSCSAGSNPASSSNGQVIVIESWLRKRSHSLVNPSRSHHQHDDDQIRLMMYRDLIARCGHHVPPQANVSTGRTGRNDPNENAFYRFTDSSRRVIALDDCDCDHDQPTSFRRLNTPTEERSVSETERERAEFGDFVQELWAPQTPQGFPPDSDSPPGPPPTSPGDSVMLERDCHGHRQDDPEPEAEPSPGEHDDEHVNVPNEWISCPQCHCDFSQATGQVANASLPHGPA